MYHLTSLTWKQYSLKMFKEEIFLKSLLIFVILKICIDCYVLLSQVSAATLLYDKQILS